jgi:hypothetical protein
MAGMLQIIIFSVECDIRFHRCHARWEVSLLRYSPCIQKLRFHQLIYRSCSKAIILILAILFMFLTAIHFSFFLKWCITISLQVTNEPVVCVVLDSDSPFNWSLSKRNKCICGCNWWIRGSVMYKVDCLPSMYKCQKCNCPRKLIMFVNVHWILCFSHWP